MTEWLAEPLTPEDAQAQSMTQASPTKWHMAHTTWFFEEFVLAPHAAGYKRYHPQFAYLFNSYYNAVGDRVARPNRGVLTRPGMQQVHAYRKQVDRDMIRFMGDMSDDQLAKLGPLITIGLHHEQQHQELILTDIKHLLSHNPLRPVYREREHRALGPAPALRWFDFEAGLYTIGHDGAGFAYDNESPRHQAYLQPFRIASRPVTNGEYMQFIDDGGYARHELWLDLGWATVNAEGWRHPLYWERRHGEWWQFSLAGMQRVMPDEPVTHVSLFETDAYARWAGKRLPTEFEWEVAAAELDPTAGNFVETERLHPAGFGAATPTDRPIRMYGDGWEWTRSQYEPYPGYAAEPGALGEYNGKFMCNQFVLRGGSCATSASHIRRTYRNFFGPETRWQFSAIRLADNAE